MKCPNCTGAELAVIESRDSDDGRAVRRRRLCQGCNHRFTTYERFEERPASQAQIESIALSIELKAQELGAFAGELAKITKSGETL